MWIKTLFVCTLVPCISAGILFPEELSTITGIIYSILPPMKIGQDSRLGFGFRLGRNADAQVLIELGPQSETSAVGEGDSRRQTARERPTLSAEERQQLMQKWLDRIRTSWNITEPSKNNITGE